MLNKNAIEQELLRGSIKVDNSQKNLGDNFIAVTLGDKIKVYDTPSLNVTQSSPTREIEIPEEGLILKPNELYLGRTFENTSTYGFVPLLAESEDLAASGIGIHITAGFGDNGFEGTWTLEIVCSVPIRVFKGQFMGMIYYYPLIGDPGILYRGKYFRQVEATESRLSTEYQQQRSRKKC